MRAALANVRPANWSAEWMTDWVLFLGALSLALALGSVRAIGGGFLESRATLADLLVAGAVSLSLIGANGVIGLYLRDSAPAGRIAGRALAALAVDSAIIYLAIFMLTLPHVRAAGTAFPVLPYAVVLGSLRPVLYVLGRIKATRRRVLIVGDGSDALVVQRGCMAGRGDRVEIVGILPIGAGNEVHGLRLFERGTDLARLVAQHNIHEVIVAAREQRGGVLPLRALLECRVHGVRITDQTTYYERLRGEFPLESLKASWLIYGRGFEQGAARRFAKRCTDIVASLGLIVFALPIMAAAVLAIRLESPGPVIYRQERVGRGGRTFQVLKFRSMCTDAERDGVARWAGAGDARITRVGRIMRKTRIDELPQLFNVLRGDMSIVGPRPERPTFVEQLKRDVRFYDLRHSIKPGLTGWAQVRFSYAASLEDSCRKLQFDLYYVKNHSLALDLRILLETVRVVLRGEGAR